jgi:membrane protease YdiL (CAAX protease family)
MVALGSVLRSFHLLFFGFFVPVIAIRTRRRVNDRFFADRKRQLRAMILQLVGFATFSMAVAGSSAIDLFPLLLPSMRSVAAGLAVLVLAVLVMRPLWRKAVVEGERIIYYFMPSDREERRLWIVVSALAGFSEEVTWRGVQTTLLAHLTGSTAAAIAISIAMFSVSHIQQGWKSVFMIVPFAAAFHLLVLFGGSLYVAMVVHFLYDAIAGLTYGHLGRKLGYRAMDHG